MSIKGLMTRSPQAVDAATTVEDACDAMNRTKVGALAVTDKDELAGIFTYQDLVERVILEKRDPRVTTLAQVMTTEVVSLSVDASFGDALRLMVERDYTYLPILDEGGRFAGLLSLRGLLEHKIDHLASELDAVTQYLAVDGPGGD